MDDNAPANLRHWPVEDLLILARAAGQLWDSTGCADPLDVLNDRQRRLLDRAAASYLIAEQGSPAYGEPGHVNTDGSVTTGSTPGWLASQQAAERPLASGELIEYVNHAIGPGSVKGWVPGTFGKYAGDGQHVLVHTLRDSMRKLRQPHRSIGYAVSLLSEVRRVSPELISAARSWAADCQWADADTDIADLADVAVIAGVQRYYDGGWAQFARDGGQLAPMRPDRT